MSFRAIREQLLKEGHQAKCKFCHRQLATRLWVDIQMARARLSPYPNEVKWVEKRFKEWINSSGLCNDCEKFADKMDKLLR